MLKNLSIAKRLNRTFLILSFLVALSGIAGIISVAFISYEADYIYETEFPAVRQSFKLKEDALHEVILIHSVLLGEKGSLERLSEETGKLHDHINELKKTETGKEYTEVIEELEVIYQSFLQLTKKITSQKGMLTGEELEEVNLETETLTGKMIAALDNMIGHAEDEMKKAMNLADQTQLITNIGLVLVSVIAILLAIGLGKHVAQGITTPLNTLVKHLDQLAAGDLSKTDQLDVMSDEIGSLNQSFNRLLETQKEMTTTAEAIAAGDLTTQVEMRSENDTLGIAFRNMLSSLNTQIQTVVQGTNTLASSVSEISASSAQLAASSAENATAISQTTSTVEEVRQTTDLASKKAEQMADNAHQIRETSQSGRDATLETISGIKKIADQMTLIAETIIGLSQQSQSIGQIIASVDSISEQSNVLAVNASIEAAKAGEHGKGFSVVAQEVKLLAEQSKKATAQVREILNEIQKSTNTAIMATEQGNKVVEKVTTEASDAGKAIENLALSVDQTADVLTQIAASSQQQRVGMDQINAAMENVSEASQQNASSAKQLETAVHNLNSLGDELKQIVQSYRLN